MLAQKAERMEIDFVFFFPWSLGDVMVNKEEAG